MKIQIVGDVHAEFDWLNSLIARRKPDVLIACGDFGYWPKYNKNGKLTGFMTDKIKADQTKVFWCDGNHEHFELLKLNTSNIQKPFEINKNVFYCPRGAVLSFDEKKFLFMGGADSIDKNIRIRGYDWFPEEILSYQDYLNLPDTNIDVVISHTCPDMIKDVILSEDPRKNNDPSTSILQMVYEKYLPQKWFFGHWHIHKIFKTEQTEFVALNKSLSAFSWVWF